ncbi:MAG TPA: TM2 domain-containing protein [Reyranella sp.]|jgi:TM2 domain-containing membrane protein YozV|nr:TM2 domain-containing protein [Reyranella sp.]
MSNVPTPASDAARLMQYDAAKKSALIAYVLWFFLGGLGVHRFYLGRTGSGVVMAIISVLSWITVYIGIGFIGLAVIGIWWLLDAFLIPGITTSANQELATRLAQ